jgi:protein-tyrosine phosphatase
VIGDRLVHWPDCTNVRELGGLPTADGGATAYGVLLRADDLGRLGADGWTAVAASGVTRVVDLRFPDERERDLPRPDTVEYHPISLLGERDPAYWAMLHADRESLGEDAYMRLSYTDFLERHAKRFAQAVETVASTPRGAAVVHCVGGKDRTGLVVGLILRLVGVPLDVVDTDYALSGQYLQAGGMVATDHYGAKRAPVSPAGVMAAVLGAVENEHGSAEAYLLQAGCAPAALAAMRARLAP